MTDLRKIHNLLCHPERFCSSEGSQSKSYRKSLVDTEIDEAYKRTLQLIKTCQVCIALYQKKQNIL